MTSLFERPVFVRARKLCLKWPEVTEKTGWGHPCFRAGKKMFCAFEMIKGRPSVAFKVPHRTSKQLLDRDAYFVTPYGRAEWISVWVDGAIDWIAIETLVEQSYRGVATKGMLRLLAGNDRLP